jgi:hypothetical protein
MTRYLLALTLLAATAVHAQEGPTPTQALVAFDSKAPVSPTANDLILKVDNRITALTSLTQVAPNGTQIVLLIDNGLRTSMGRELNNLRAFVTSLPAGTEIYVGYMQNGQVVPGGNISGFTTNLAAAADTIHIPTGLPGISASPYFCLSSLVKNWPGRAENQVSPMQRSPEHMRRARFVLMITNGVDPYNGSTSILNQNSPYVTNTIQDAQSAGVPVYSIYFSDAGFGRNRGSFSGQSYLAQLAQGTGGAAFYQGTGNPVSLQPYLKQFQDAVAATYVATFPVDANKKFVNLKLSTNLPKTKARAPELVRPGTIVSSQQ